MEDLLVDEKMLKEEEAAREERKTTDKPRAGGGLTHERLQKLDVLLDQAQMYSKFLTEQVETIQKEIEVVSFRSLATRSFYVAVGTCLAWLCQYCSHTNSPNAQMHAKARSDPCMCSRASHTRVLHLRW